MNTLIQWLEAYGLSFAFVNVLVEQLGFPVPAYPVLVVTGALSVDGRFSPLGLLATTVLACLIADLAWYAAGRRHGSKVMRLICRVSISPDSCVRQTESLFERWGVRSLVVAKFIPGFGTLAAALAGNMRVPLAVFFVADLAGAVLYCGLGIGIGMFFHTAVDQIVLVLEEMGRIGIALIALGLVAFLLSKWWQRKRLLRELRGARITVLELQRQIDDGHRPAIIDVRPAASRARDGTIPGALAWPLSPAQEGAGGPDPALEVIVYCACPNEVSAAKVARQLKGAGFVNVRPLLGGIEAWISAGLPVERSVQPLPPAT